MRVLTSATLLLCFVLITTGCPQELVMPVEFSELQTDKTFNYETIRQVSIDLSFSDYPSILVDLYAAIEITEETYAHADPFEEFTPLGTILLSSDGTYSAGLSVPSAATVLVISPRFPGIPGTLKHRSSRMQSRSSIRKRMQMRESSLQQGQSPVMRDPMRRMGFAMSVPSIRMANLRIPRSPR